VSKKLERGQTVDHTARLLFGKKKTDNVILGIQSGNYRNSFSRGVLMSKKSIKLSQACEGMIRYKQATGKSENTIADYRVAFKKLFCYFKSDPPIHAITRGEMIGFFAWLQEDYLTEPDGVAPRGKFKLSAKTVLNTYTNLSALWHWAVDDGFAKTNIIRTIQPPAVSESLIETFTRDDIEKLLQACDHGRTWKTRSETASERSTAVRDRAIVLTLLDTGARASELAGMKFGDLNMSTNSIRVRGKGPGRDAKERLVYIGKRTAQAIWKFLVPRLNDLRDEDPIFVVGPKDDLRPLSRCHLLKLMKRLGERAGVKKVHPHRFRHTFAINYLRNGGGEFTLCALLGHTDLEMTRRYARIAQVDTANGHRKAGPVDNWKL
jgi:integrase/recombinase XerD